jgi:hypothetical protein
LTVNGPVQPPEAAQVVALDELHVNVAAPPLVTAGGFAVNVAVGTTLTMAVATGLVPPAPEQVSENKEFVATGPVLLLPLTASAPVQLPVAAHAVALLEVQVKVDAPPPATTTGAAAKVAVGSGGAVTVTSAVAAGLVPPAPVQVSEYDVSAVRGPVLRVPLVANAPVQPPDAVHDVAFVEFQVSVVDSPPVSVVCEAIKEAVGAGVLP